MKLDSKWILVILVGVLLFSFSGSVLPKESVAAVDGQPCKVDKDCPCMGKYNLTQFPGATISDINATTYGIGIADCKIETGTIGKCDMTYCVDIQPVGAWLKNNPWDWVKKNSLAAFAILGIVLVIIFWPKRT